MNPQHHPSLELCKKLTETGVFKVGSTEKIITQDGKIYRFRSGTGKRMWECPNVMEMLDVMPISIYLEGCAIPYWLTIHPVFGVGNKGYTVSYANGNDKTAYKYEGTLPNALAEMVLWLYENKYITFNNGN